MNKSIITYEDYTKKKKKALLFTSKTLRKH